MRRTRNTFTFLEYRLFLVFAAKEERWDILELGLRDNKSFVISILASLRAVSMRFTVEPKLEAL